MSDLCSLRLRRVVARHAPFCLFTVLFSLAFSSESTSTFAYSSANLRRYSRVGLHFVVGRFRSWSGCTGAVALAVGGLAAIGGSKAISFLSLKRLCSGRSAGEKGGHPVCRMMDESW